MKLETTQKQEFSTSCSVTAIYLPEEITTSIESLIFWELVSRSSLKLELYRMVKIDLL
jgi:hypothetical protein